MHSEKDKAVAAVIDRFLKGYGSKMPANNFDSGFIRASKITSVSAETDTANAKITYSLTIPPLYANNPIAKTTHGGAIATWFDMATSMAVIACKNTWEEGTGVTRNLNVTYFRPPVEGEEITIESEVMQLTKRLATIKGVMKRVSDGTVLAICQHDKYRPSRVTPGKPNPKL
jgi:acyl-coenzyme A thioesterase 13